MFGIPCEMSRLREEWRLHMQSFGLKWALNLCEALTDHTQPRLQLISYDLSPSKVSSEVREDEGCDYNREQDGS